MGENNQLTARMQELEHKVSETQQDVRDIKESIKELQKLIEFQVSNKAKGIEATAATSNNNTSASMQHEDRVTRFAATGNNYVPRYTKLEFPSYNGTGDPLGWLYRCEQFFNNQRTEEREKVGLAAFHMTDEAQLWYYRVEQEEPALTWVEFKDYCSLRFGPPMSSNPLGELVNLKQTGTVEDYQRQFQTLLARAASVHSGQQVDLFTAGLTETLRMDVEMQSPPNLVTAMNLARAFERKMQLNRGGFSVGRPPTLTSSKQLGAAPTLASSQEQKIQGNNSESASNLGSEIVTPPIKLLSKAEMSERRARGQCFNCDALYSPGHKCKRLFCLLLYDPEEEGTFLSEC